MKRALGYARRRTSARPALESLEVRLVLSPTPTVRLAVPPAPPLPILVPPATLPVNVSVGYVAPRRDDVFLDALQTLGGGRREALPRFPESGGVSERHLDDETVRGLIDTDGPDVEAVDGQVFGGDLDALGRSLVHAEDVEVP